MEELGLKEEEAEVSENVQLRKEGILKELTSLREVTLTRVSS